MTPAGQGARTLTYDALQNLTSDGITTFGFDLENRMLSASKVGMSAVYTYDPLGRRVAKSVNGVGTATLFDGDSEIGDIEGGRCDPRKMFRLILGDLNLDGWRI